VAGVKADRSADAPVVRVQVTFFAPFRYQLGLNECGLEFPQTAVSVGELLVALRERWPRLRLPDQGTSGDQCLRGLSVVVNGQARNAGFSLENGDEVSILGPISGG
jgi:molybdopterin converting factor small subunit